MNPEMCELLDVGSSNCSFSSVWFGGMFIIVVSFVVIYAFFATLSSLSMRKVCHRCRKQMKEQSFDSRGYGPSDYKHTYRTFFWVCRCGHTERQKVKPELIS